MVKFQEEEVSSEKNVLLRALGTEEKVGLDVKTLVIEEDDHYFFALMGYQTKFLLMICDKFYS